jgi:hypothetical protein
MDASTCGAGVTWPPRAYGITVMSAWPRAMLSKLAAAPHIGIALLAPPTGLSGVAPPPQLGAQEAASQQEGTLSEPTEC